MPLSKDDEIEYKRKKRNLAQSYDKSPYTDRKIQKAT